MKKQKALAKLPYSHPERVQAKESLSVVNKKRKPIVGYLSVALKSKNIKLNQDNYLVYLTYYILSYN